MAFTRAFLKALGLTDEQVGAIIDEHTGVTDALKKQRDDYKAEADKLADARKELDALKGEGDYKARYEEEHKSFEAYKADVAKKENRAKVEAEYRKLLADEKISAKRIDAVIRLTDLDGMKLDKDGHLTDTDKLREDIRKDWSEYITETTERGAKVDTPPTTGKPTASKAAILAIKDTAERQKAIAENHELFGF